MSVLHFMKGVYVSLYIPVTPAHANVAVIFQVQNKDQFY